MRVTQRGSRFVVVDDFLSPPALAAARELMERSALAEVDSVIAPGGDGRARRSNGIRFREGVVGADAGARPAVYREITRTVAENEQIFGERGTAWDSIATAFWQYPAGSRLGWHTDAGMGRRGEFVLFLHEQWKSSWGGELLILDEDLREPEDAERGVSLEDRMEALVAGATELPVAVLPWPNRLVLVKAGTVHTIRRVDPTAGTALRRTLTGFVSQREPARGDRSKLAALLGQD